MLLLLSLLFIVWTGKEQLKLFLVFVLVNYGFGLILGETRKKEGLLKNSSIWLVIISNLGFLISFKYLPFITETLELLSGRQLPMLELPILLGVSFFAFSAIAYQYDVSYKKTEPQKNIVDFFLYMSFFPKLIQGPIMREGEFARQLSDLKINTDNLSEGTFRFAIGLAKKVIIADQLGGMVDQIFANSAISNGVSTAWLGALGYAMQIFFDFSGYTDMAIGIGRMFGFKLPENFNSPYLALSISDFWHRWHITLSNWFRDYVFYPLEFKRRKQKKFRVESNTLIVFLLTGIWHGAGWQFVVWGLWHGLFSALDAFLRAKKVEPKAPKFVRYILTMMIVLVGWVIFRSPDLGYGLNYLGIMFGFVKPMDTGLTVERNLNAKNAVILVLAILACIPWNKILSVWLEKLKVSKMNDPIRVLVFLLLMVLSFVIVMSSTYNSFIYFKF